MSQLVKIVLIDSLCAGAKAELIMEGNTSVTGENGIGKSSFIKLIPVFYGASPGRLVKAGANRESFANWYLPRASSFIVFEYLNHADQPRCAIMHRSGDSYSYRLVSSGWHQELLYRDYESGHLVLPGDLHHHLTQQGVMCSPELQPYHYRQIIQFNSGTAHLERIADAGKRKLIVGLRSGFSLAPKRKDFNGIDYVTLALIESGGTFDTMKATMSEILQQDNEDPSRTLMMLNAQPFRSVIDNRAGYLLMESLKPSISELYLQAHEYRAIVRQLGTQKRRMLMIEEKLKERQNARDIAQAEINEEDQELQNQYQLRMGVFNAEKSEVKATLSDLDAWLARFEDKRTWYEQEGTQELSQKFDKLPEIRAQLNQKRDHAINLNREGADIRSVYKEREASVKETAAAARDAAFQKYVGTGQALKARGERLRETQDQLLQETRAAQLAELTELQQEQLNATDANACAIAQVAHLKALSALPSTQRELDLSQQAINEQLEVVGERQRSVASIATDGNALNQERDARAAEYNGLQHRKEVLGAQREALKAQINAGAETLLGFLRQNHSTWEEDIARLIPVETLMRTDLNPALIDQDQKSLYGVELNLEVLPKASIASIKALEDEIVTLTSQIQALGSEIDLLEKQQRNVEDRLRQHALKLSAAQKDLSNAALELQTLKGDHAGLMDRAREEVERELQIYAERVAEGKARLHQIVNQIAALNVRHEREISDIGAEGDAAQKQLTDAQRDAELELTTAKEHIDTTLAAELEQAKRDMEARLKAAGVDESESKRLASEIEELEKQVKQLQGVESLIDSYRLWMKDSVPAAPEYRAKHAHTKAELGRIDRSIEQWRAEIQAVQKSISVRRKALATEGHEDGLEMSAALRVQRELSQFEAAVEAHLSPAVRASDIEDEVAKLKYRRNDCHRKGSALYREMHKHFLRDSLMHTPQGAAFEQIMNHAAHAAIELEFAWLEAAPNLHEYLEISHPDQKTKLIIQAKNLSDELCDNRSKLQQLHRSIQKLGRDATEKASEVLSAFAQIRQFEFKVTSRIHNMSFWDDLTNYEQQYRRWASVPIEQIPSDSFMEALRTIERQIKDGAFTSKLSDCFDVSVTCNDQGRVKVATNNAELIHLSSTGLTKIIVAMIYVSLFELLRNEADFQMSIPIDEALELSPENYVALVNYFNERGLSMLACFPGGAPELLRQFNNRYSLERRPDTDSIVVKEYGIEEHDELDDLNAALGHEDGEDAL